MFNAIYTSYDKVFIQRHGKCIEMKEKMNVILEYLCLLSGTTFKGSIQASKKLLPKAKKVPIYLSSIDDYLIPLASCEKGDCLWIRARRYLTCYETDGRCYIKFKDRSVLEVIFSIFTIKMQYQKYWELEQKREELLANSIMPFEV